MNTQSISQNEVHIWLIQLDPKPHPEQSDFKDLSAEEVNRAERFYFERHRRRFATSHTAMRKILSEYLEISPDEIVFDHSSHGKPGISGPHKESGIRFNLTHSHELAVVAVTRGGEIGVDVEYVKKFGDIDGIAARFFSSVEQEAYLELPGDEKVAGFFNCWTRKEAFIKAIGEGLSHPLNQFDVTLKPGEPASFLRIGDDKEEASFWSLEPIQTPTDYVGAIALRVPEVQIRQINFE